MIFFTHLQTDHFLSPLFQNLSPLSNPFTNCPLSQKNVDLHQVTPTLYCTLFTLTRVSFTSYSVSVLSFSLCFGKLLQLGYDSRYISKKHTRIDPLLYRPISKVFLVRPSLLTSPVQTSTSTSPTLPDAESVLDYRRNSDHSHPYFSTGVLGSSILHRDSV